MLQQYVDAGFDEIHIGQIGPDQQGFYDFYAKELVPGSELPGSESPASTGV